jgi:hypothetical protein
MTENVTTDDAAAAAINAEAEVTDFELPQEDVDAIEALFDEACADYNAGYEAATEDGRYEALRAACLQTAVERAHNYDRAADVVREAAVFYAFIVDEEVPASNG